MESKLKKAILNLKHKVAREVKILKIDYAMRRKVKLKVMTSFETLEYIKKNRCSVSRFGDGEFRVMFTDQSIGFQKNTKALSQDLKRIFLERDNEKLLVCIPYTFYNHNKTEKKSREVWKYIIKLDYGDSVNEILGKNCKYMFGDAQISRPWMDFQNKKRAQKIFDELKSIWEDRDVVIVEGEKTKMGIGNDLFSNVRSIKRITVPSTGAYEKYQKIKETVKKTVKDELVLLAIGPTATVLAADLSKEGIWAFDIGHVDVEYEWFLRGAKEKIKLDGKFVNEASGGRTVETVSNAEYEKQIVSQVK